MKKDSIVSKLPQFAIVKAVDLSAITPPSRTGAKSGSSSRWSD
jgi:hypothetical protein